MYIHDFLSGIYEMGRVLGRVGTSCYYYLLSVYLSSYLVVVVCWRWGEYGGLGCG